MRRLPLIRAGWPVAAALGVAGMLAACAGADRASSTSPEPVADAVPATISKPSGPGPFAAVVIMHDCSGLGPRSSGAPARWAKELVGRGYLVMLPDSFTPRGVPDGVCVAAPPRGVNVSPDRRARDAYAALAQLRRRADVDGRRVGIMGGSHGGSSTLATMRVSGDDAGDVRAGFAAAVALYPRCAAFTGAFGVYRPRAPLLILIGESDDWTPAEACRVLADRAEKAGHPVAINPSVPGGRGATTGGHPAAWADSIQQVAAFFGRHLAP